MAIVSLTSVYDDMVRKRLHSAPQNAKYVHHDIQNDILSSASSLVRQLIVTQVVEAGVYAVMADETRDTSKAEQMSIVLRYVRDGETMRPFFASRSVRDWKQEDSVKLSSTLCRRVASIHSGAVRNVTTGRQL